MEAIMVPQEYWEEKVVGGQQVKISWVMIIMLVAGAYVANLAHKASLCTAEARKQASVQVETVAATDPKLRIRR
jgi:hypothetical protein